MFAVGLSYMAFIMLRYVTSMPAFWRVFYHKWMLNFVKGFLCIYWNNHMVFIFQFVNVVYHIYWFVNIEESLHPWDKASWLGHDVWSFNMLLDSPSADKWIRKLWYIYPTHYYSAIKMNAFESVLMRWMKLEPIIQNEVSQKEKHQYSILNTYIWNFKRW